METVKLKIVSALDKHFYDDDIDRIPVLEKASVLLGEDFSFQAVYIDTDHMNISKKLIKVKVESEAAEYIKVSTVDHVPVRFPVYRRPHDDNYQRTAPGLYPDLLVPVKDGENLYLVKDELKSLWFDVKISEDSALRNFSVKITITDIEENELASETLGFKVIGIPLPPQEFIVTQWFHCDCLADYYGVEVFSEEHWRIIGEFIKTAVDNGINMILTPVVTPPLDTVVGGERLTVQLVDIAKDGDKWSFGFEKLERWVKLCLSLGITHFEISHLFTQWGAKHAPKIMATVDGTYKRIFGWDTDASGKEYSEFLSAFLPALTDELKKLDIAKNTYFHISDEPYKDQLESYLAAKATVSEFLSEFKIIDALSDISFYESGAVAHPIPANNHIEPFLEANIPELWTYYCCGQDRDVSNRFLSMPLHRTRIIGTQFYKFNLAGFLQWGYNFYYSQYSIRQINPYHCNDGEYFVPAGDAFSVYPAPGGSAYETIRLRAFAHGLADLRAMKLCEKLCGREAVMKEIERDLEKPITFSEYPKDANYILELRERINEMIEKAI